MSKLTKRDYERINSTKARLMDLGLSTAEFQTLRRASMTLQRWGEMECSHDVSRDESTGKVTISYCRNDGSRSKPMRIPDRETPALNRCQAIASKHGLIFYHQGDPRGAAVYIGTASMLNSHNIESNYSSLICVY